MSEPRGFCTEFRANVGFGEADGGTAATESFSGSWSAPALIIPGARRSDRPPFSVPGVMRVRPAVALRSWRLFLWRALSFGDGASERLRLISERSRKRGGNKLDSLSLC